MKELNGAELAGFIKERQARAVRGLVQAHGVKPKLVIIRTNPDPVVDSYMRLKTGYGQDIGAEVEVCDVEQSGALDKIAQYNADQLVHGIIVQIPLPDVSQTDEILNSVIPEKDVDGLSSVTVFDPPTPVAINWLLAGYNIELVGKELLIIGQGRLVGKPLAAMWQNSGLVPKLADRSTDVSDLSTLALEADVLICATGVPGLITSDMVKPNAVIVDAGVATDSNGLVGDVSQEVRELPHITITPVKGGVGPLTVCALFENLLIAARHTMIDV